MAAEGTLAVVGGGRMGEALVVGVLRSGIRPAGSVVVVEKLPGRRDELARAHPGLTVVARVADAAGDLDGAVLAVKPGDAEPACRDLAAAGVGRVLSVAAGVTVASLEAWLGGPEGGSGAAVVRAMPNTPALVGAGAAAIAAGTTAGPEDLAWATAILEAVGSVVTVPESALDAVTGLSGSGPAYVFLFAEALIDAGVLVGLPRDVARRLATQTLLGSARLLSETGEEPSALRAAVTSPGGTTAAGLRALETAAWRAAVLDAVVAATDRSKALGAPPG